MPGLADLLMRMIVGKIEAPSVPQPSIFEPDPEVLSSDPMIANIVYELVKMNPLLRKQVSRVQSGPTAGVASVIDADDGKFGVHDYPKLNLLGLFDRGTREVSINPRLSAWPYVNEPSPLEVLAHEFAHAGGATEPEAEAVETAWRKDPMQTKIMSSIQERMKRNKESRRAIR